MDNQGKIIQQCLEGDKNALELLIKNIQERVYNLAVRFYWNPVDAQDATQEILIKIITNLASFKGHSKFETWSYRVASNHLINSKRNRTEEMTFDIGSYHLKQGLNYDDYTKSDALVLAEEVKIGCTTSMLSCLSRPLRLAYILGEILEFNGTEGAYILEIDSATFRKRLSVSRKNIRTFMGRHCGIFEESNPCRCSKQIQYDLKIQRLNPKKLLFADKGTIRSRLDEVEMITKEAAIFRGHPDYKVPNKILDAIKILFSSGKYNVLND